MRMRKQARPSRRVQRALPWRFAAQQQRLRVVSGLALCVRPTVASMPWSVRMPAITHHNRWCSLSNRGHYKQSDSAGLPQWSMDGRQGHGWRWCSITVDECKRACLRLGECKEIYYTEARCCFPSKAHCTGDSRPGGSGGPLAGKYVFSPEPQSQPPPPSPPPPPESAEPEPASAAGEAPSTSLPTLVLLVATFVLVAMLTRRCARRMLGGRRKHRYARVPSRDPIGSRGGDARRRCTSMPVFDFTTNSFRAAEGSPSGPPEPATAPSPKTEV